MVDRQTLARLLEAPERATASQLYGVALDALDYDLEPEIIAALTPRLAPGGSAAGDYRLWQVLGLAHRQQLASAAAEAAFARAHALAPSNALIAHSLARSRLEAGRPDVGAFDAALALAPGDQSIVQGRLLALLATGEGARALGELEALLELRRDWFDGHLTWAKLTAIVTPGADRYAPLRRALARYPSDPQLHWVALRLALLLKDWPVAREWLAPARTAIGARADLIRIEAIVLSETGDLAGAEARFASLPPARLAEELPGPISNLIRQGRLEQAAQLADTRFSGAQDIQLWPFRSLLWHALGDPRWAWLEGDERLIATYDLSAELGDLAALNACLQRLHDASGAPVGQSVRAGSQTEGNLFAREEPEIQRLRAAIDRAVAAHCARLQPPLAGHPTRIAAPRRHRYAGSWSIRLRGEGHHVDHIHSEGWISGAIHLIVPDAVDHGHDGWLILGANRALLPDLPPHRRVRPKVGQLVLFPSLMWHGTMPFGGGERMSVAFDVARPAG